MQKHKKASDIFNENDYPFAPKTTFEEAYPEVEDIRIEVQEGGYDESKHHKATYLYPDLPGQYVDCTNPRCYGGGFSVGGMLREMVRARMTDHEKTSLCRGYEGSPKGRRRRRDCHHIFHVKISVKYKSEPATLRPGETAEKT